MAKAIQRPSDGRDDGLSMPEWHRQFRQVEVPRILIADVGQRWSAPAWTAMPNWLDG
jgi:hypothetical protein